MSEYSILTCLLTPGERHATSESGQFFNGRIFLGPRSRRVYTLGVIIFDDTDHRQGHTSGVPRNFFFSVGGSTN